MWKYYRLTMHVDKLVGGIPKNPDLIKSWQEANKPKGWSDAQVDAAAKATTELMGEQADEEAEFGWTGFVSHPDGGIGLEARNVKAMLKESANIIKGTFPKAAKLGWLRAKLAERVFVEPKVIALGREQPDGYDERAIHVMTRQGPRDALKRADYVADVKVECTLRVLDDGSITDEILRAILEHAGFNGLGADRSQGEGTFTWELEPIDS